MRLKDNHTSVKMHFSALSRWLPCYLYPSRIALFPRLARSQTIQYFSVRGQDQIYGIIEYFEVASDSRGRYKMEYAAALVTKVANTCEQIFPPS